MKITDLRSDALKLESCLVKTFVIYLSIFTFLCGLAGCAVWDFIEPEKPPYYKELWGNYNLTRLNESSSADVLTTLQGAEHELLSHSKSIIASVGQKKRGYHTWLNMVAFDENELTAKRKYLLVINERPRILFTEPWEGVSLDSEMVLERDVLDEPYSNENARLIAILRRVKKNARADIGQVSSDNKMLKVCGMVINQALEAVLVKLDSSGALASKLNEPAGVKFHHNSFDRGKIQMVVADDVVTVKIMLGSFVKHFEKREQPQQDKEGDIKNKM